MVSAAWGYGRVRCAAGTAAAAMGACPTCAPSASRPPSAIAPMLSAIHASKTRDLTLLPPATQFLSLSLRLLSPARLRDSEVLVGVLWNTRAAVKGAE